MMIKCFHIVLLACLMIAAPVAMAQDTLDLKPTAVEPRSASPALGDILPQGTETRPEFDRDDTAGLSNHFYNRCMDTPDPLLDSYDQESYCTCLSAQLYSKDLSMAERHFIVTGEGPRVDSKRIKKAVFAPCVSIPARAQVMKDCKNQQNPFKYVRSFAALDLFCQCIVDDLDYYLNEVAPVFVQADRQREPYTDDPVKTVIGSWDFKTQYANSRSRCVKYYGRKD